MNKGITEKNNERQIQDTDLYIWITANTTQTKHKYTMVRVEHQKVKISKQFACQELLKFLCNPRLVIWENNFVSKLLEKILISVITE